MKNTILWKPQYDITEKGDIVNTETGELYEGELNETIHWHEKRPDGSLRVSQDFRFCPTLAEQHTAHLSDINWLMDKFQPDELAAYIAQRDQYRQEILGHDFSEEPDLQEARNVTYILKQSFEKLPDEIKNNFRNHVEFLKFIDNPLNQEKMLKMGLLKPKEIAQLTSDQKLSINNDDLNDDKTSTKTSTKNTKQSSKNADE